MVPVLTTSRAGLPSTWTESLGALAIRASYRATNEIRASDQYDHGEGTRDHNPASPSGACRRGDRMKCHLAHLPARCADRPPLSGPDMMLVYAWLAAPAARPKYRRTFLFCGKNGPRQRQALVLFLRRGRSGRLPPFETVTVTFQTSLPQVLDIGRCRACAVVSEGPSWTCTR